MLLLQKLGTSIGGLWIFIEPLAILRHWVEFLLIPVVGCDLKTGPAIPKVELRVHADTTGEFAEIGV